MTSHIKTQRKITSFKSWTDNQLPLELSLMFPFSANNPYDS